MNTLKGFIIVIDASHAFEIGKSQYFIVLILPLCKISFVDSFKICKLTASFFIVFAISTISSMRSLRTENGCMF